MFAQLLAEIPPPHLAVTEQIIALAQQRLAISVQDTLFLGLKRSHQLRPPAAQQRSGDQKLPAVGYQAFLCPEFAVGREALALIEARLNITLPEDEAGFIALHLANAKNNSDMHSTMQSATIIKDVLTILKYDLHITLNEESLDYQRFITHLKFFALRLLNRDTVTHGDDSIYQGITGMMPAAYACAMKVYDYVEKNYDCQLTTDEVMFLTIHINRLSGV